MKDDEKLIKGIIYKSTIEEAPKFTDLIGEGIAELGEGIFIKFWNDGSMHQSKLNSLKNPEDPYFFSTSLNGAKVDTYDLDRLPADYKKYKSDLLIKATKALKDSLKKDSNMKVKDRDYIEIKSPSDVKKETVNFIKREYKLVKRITCKKTYPGSEAADFEVDYYDMRLRRWDDDKIHLDYEFDDSTADKIDKMTLEQANAEFKKLNNEISKLQGNIIYEDKSLKFDSLKKDSNMKKYKIGNRIITADSATKALEIHKLLDSKVKDGTAKDIVEDLKSRFPGIQLKTTSMGDNNRHYILVEVVSYANNNENSVRNYLKHLADKYKSTHSSVVSHSNEIFIQDSKMKDGVENNLSSRKLRTPRGEFNVYNGSYIRKFRFEPDADDWGLWFDHMDDDGVLWKIMHNAKNQHAVAVRVKDSISDSKVEDSDQTDIFNEIKSKYPGVKFVNVVYEKEKFEGRTVADFSFNIIGNLPNGLNRFDLTKKEPFERFVKWVMEKHGYRQVNVSTDFFRNELRVIAGGFKSIKDSISDESIEELSEEERQAIEDYKKAIAETNDPKMLKLFAHILKEETEHLEELQTGEMEDSIKDAYELPRRNNSTYYYKDRSGEMLFVTRSDDGWYINGGDEDYEDEYCEYAIEVESYLRQNGAKLLSKR